MYCLFLGGIIFLEKDYRKKEEEKKPRTFTLSFCSCGSLGFLEDRMMDMITAGHSKVLCVLLR